MVTAAVSLPRAAGSEDHGASFRELNEFVIEAIPAPAQYGAAASLRRWSYLRQQSGQQKGQTQSTAIGTREESVGEDFG